MALRKKIVHTEIGQVSPYEFDGTLEGIKKLVTELKEKYKNFDNVRIDFYNPWDEEPPYFTVYGDRLETDVELDKRQRELTRKKVSKAERKEKRRRQYENLRQEFDGDS
tara:strand:- start:95 stop:421 length:327 start_codon:yes stop_codon:yes gene_type:complete